MSSQLWPRPAESFPEVNGFFNRGSPRYRWLTVTVCVVLASTGVHAQNKEQDRLENSGVVLEEILGIPDNIPQELLEKAECVVVIPSLVKVALGIGGNYGRGAMVCRTGPGFSGRWGSPAMYAIDGGSFGLQLVHRRDTARRHSQLLPHARAVRRRVARPRLDE